MRGFSNLKSLQCTSKVQPFTDSKRTMSLRHSSVYKNSTSLPNNNPPTIYSLPNKLTCRYCLKVFKTKKSFRSHNQLGCKSYLKVGIEKGKPQNVKSKVQKNVKVKQDNLLNKSTDHDLYRSLSVLSSNFKEQTAIHFLQRNTHAWKHKQEIEEINNTHLERSTRNVVKCIDGIACKNSDEQFVYSVVNIKKSPQCNNSERNSPLNACKSVDAVTSSLPEEKSKSEETTTEVVWTDGECSSDDNRQEELFDSSDSCSGDIFCKCNRCRKSHVDDSPKAKSKDIYAFPCDLCNKKCRRPFELKLHKESKCGSLKLFNCEVCCRGFTTKFCLKEHINTVHCVEKPFNCDICQAKFATKTRLIKHVTKVHQKKCIALCQTCEFCKKGFSRRDTLLRHISTFHKGDEFICAHCSKVVNSKQYLLHHIKKKHLNQVVFKCRKCPKSFVTEKGLQNHLSQNCLIKNICCEICAKTFKESWRFKQHLLTHTGEKPFVCDTCGKCFRTDSNLNQHSVTHSDKRPFTCDVCDKSFRIKHHLRQHMAVHGMVNTSSARNRQKVT